jgi:WD40 repeat protein/serine/threonine protein kinase
VSPETVFAQAIEIASDGDRAAFLDRACGGDEALRREVERLVRNHFRAGSFLEGFADGAPTGDESPGGERPGTLIGPYKLLQQIGEGGMGAVFMAEQVRPVQRRVALKIIKPGMDSRQVIARFEAERQALALMDHQNIARVLDAGTTPGGRPYFVMELVHGVPLTKFCDDRKLTPRERLELFVPVCQAIQHAHQKGVIHRDVKPSNILVTMYDDRPVPKVIDFGVAKAIEQRLTDKTMFTQFGAFVGTFEYMSPEQAEMNAFGVDTRSDIYSLGVVLYELLTGTTPLEQKRLREAALDEMVRLIREEEAPRPSVRLSSSNNLPKIAAARNTEPARLSRLIRGDIDWIVMKCLEKDRTRRYESASGLARDIQRALADEPVEACPPGAGYRLRKLARKYKKSLVIAAAFAALLLASTVVSTALAVWARSSEREATGQRVAAEAAKQEAVEQRDQAEKNFAEAQRQRAQADAHLYRSLVREARAIREARGSGYRTEVWKRLEQALRLDTPERDLTELRREAGACLGDFVGLEPTDWQCPAHARFLGYDLHPGGELFATLSFTQATSEVLVRNFVTDREIARLRPESGWFSSVKFSADGKKLLIGCSNGGVKVWQVDPAGNSGGATSVSPALRPNPATLRPDFLVPSPHFPFFVAWWEQQPISGLAVSPHGTQLAARYWSSPAISVWNLADGSLAPPFSATGAVPAGAFTPRSMAYSPRGDLMAAGPAGDNSDGVVVWDVATREVRRTLRPGFGVVFHVCFSPDGKHLACACRDGLALFDTVDFQRPLFVRNEGPWGTWMSAFSPDGRVLAIPAPESGLVRLWDIHANREVVVPVARDPVGPPFVGFSPDGNRLVSAGSNSVRVWNLAGALEKQTLSGHSGGIPGLAFSPDGKLLASTGKDLAIRLWNPVTGRVVRELRGLKGTPQSVAFDPDGRFLAASEYYGSGAVALWDVRSGKKLTTVPDDLGPSGVGATFSADGKQFVVCGPRGVRLWNVVGPGRAEDDGPGLSFEEAARPIETPADSACFSPDGRLVAWVDWVIDRSVSVWEQATGQKHSWPVNVFPMLALSFLPDGKRLVLVNQTEGKIEIRNVTDGQLRASFGKKELIQGLSIHSALSPDSAWLAVGGDKAVTVWDLNKGELLFALPEERGTIWSMAWSPDKSLLAVGSSHGGLAIWNLPKMKSELGRIGLGW